jgi:hypothetical protein
VWGVGHFILPAVEAGSIYNLAAVLAFFLPRYMLFAAIYVSPDVAA